MAPRKKEWWRKIKSVKRKERFQSKGKKSEMEKILDNQDSIREEQRKIRGMLGEIQSLCHQQKKETEMLMIQRSSARTQVRLALMFRILRAREGGDFKEAARITRVLRDITTNENEIGNLADMKDEHPSPKGKKEDDDRPASD